MDKKLRAPGEPAAGCPGSDSSSVMRRLAKRFLRLCGLALSLILFSTHAPAGPAAGLLRGELTLYSESGPNIWAQGPFRINFMRTGGESVPPADANGNNCPDFIEDMAKQLVAAHHIFINKAGFRSPFGSPRYSGLEYILVVVRAKTNKILKGSNGRSYDEMTRAKALVMAIAREIDPAGNATPAHEYFHCIENGLTYFKNTWYSEGMARWAEDAVSAVRPMLRSGTEIKKMLDDPALLRILYASSYKAADLLWRPLAHLCPETGAALAPNDPVLSLKYSNGAPVVRGVSLPGAAFMNLLLQKLGELDDTAFVDNGYGSWSEANQKNPKNNPYIVEAVKELLASTCGQR